MSRLLLVGVFFEVGLVLVFVPWTGYWEQNYFAELLPTIAGVVHDPFLRGAVSGLGVLNLYSAFSELGSILSARTDDPPTAPAVRSISEE